MLHDVVKFFDKSMKQISRTSYAFYAKTFLVKHILRDFKSKANPFKLDSLLGIEALKSAFPGAMGNWMATWPILGPMFMAAGLSHFSMKAGTI